MLQKQTKNETSLFVIVFDILLLHMNEEKMSIAHCLKLKFSHSEVWSSHTISSKI